jgi:hypothetical protein
MEATAKLKRLGTEPLRLPSLRAFLWLLAVLVLLAAVWVAWNSLEKQPFMARWKVERFLKKESHTRDFKIAFNFPSREEMAKASQSIVESGQKEQTPSKDFETLRQEYFKLKLSALRTRRRSILEENEAALVPITRDLWAYQRTWMAETSPADDELARSRNELTSTVRQKLSEANSYSEIYRLIGQELWVADGLLGSKNLEHRKALVSLALDAARNALNDAQNGWVAARICEGYILPNLSMATGNSRRSTVNSDNLLLECADIFRKNNETEHVVEIYNRMAVSAKSSQRADWARAQIAIVYEQAGNAKEAVRYMRQIQNPNDYRGLMRRMASLERQLKNN